MSSALWLAVLIYSDFSIGGVRITWISYPESSSFTLLFASWVWCTLLLVKAFGPRKLKAKVFGYPTVSAFG